MTVSFDKEKFYQKVFNEEVKEDLEDFDAKKNKKKQKPFVQNKNKVERKFVDDGTYTYRPFETFFNKDKTNKEK
jgi:hypothetical protein